VLSKADERSLSLYERRVLMHFWNGAGYRCMEEEYNHELYKLFNEPDITEYIKINRFIWAAHIICVENSRTVKKVFDIRLEGSRKMGRPELRWEDGVIQDIMALGPKNLGECGYE
jgi:hypothetical protein